MAVRYKPSSPVDLAEVQDGSSRGKGGPHFQTGGFPACSRRRSQYLRTACDYVVNDNYSSPSVTIKTHHATGLPFCCLSLFRSLSVTLWASPFGGAESLAPSGAKDAAEPKGLAGAPG